MTFQAAREPSGYVFRVERSRGPQWYAKYRLPDGRQVKKHLGPAWTDRGRPPAGYLTKRTAEKVLRVCFEQARNDTLPGLVRTDVTVDRACRKYLRWIAEERGHKALTVEDYRATLAGHFRPILKTGWSSRSCRASLRSGSPHLVSRRPSSNRTMQKVVVVFNSVLKLACRRHGSPVNPLTASKDRGRAGASTSMCGEVLQLVTAATTLQDAALFVTAAFTGLRQGGLLGLRWREVDFPAATIRVIRAFTHEALTTAKNGKPRAAPMAPEVAGRLRDLHAAQGSPSNETLVFPRPDGDFQIARQLSRRYHAALERAGLRRLRFHDLRHTFGTRMVGQVDLLELREMMGHTFITTTERYLHYRPRADLADKVAAAFAV